MSARPRENEFRLRKSISIFIQYFFIIQINIPSWAILKISAPCLMMLRSLINIYELLHAQYKFLLMSLLVCSEPMISLSALYSV